MAGTAPRLSFSFLQSYCGTRVFVSEFLANVYDGWVVIVNCGEEWWMVAAKAYIYRDGKGTALFNLEKDLYPNPQGKRVIKCQNPRGKGKERCGIS